LARPFSAAPPCRLNNRKQALSANVVKSLIGPQNLFHSGNIAYFLPHSGQTAALLFIPLAYTCSKKPAERKREREKKKKKKEKKKSCFGFN